MESQPGEFQDASGHITSQIHPLSPLLKKLCPTEPNRPKVYQINYKFTVLVTLLTDYLPNVPTFHIFPQPNSLHATNEIQFTHRIPFHTDRLLGLRFVRSVPFDKPYEHPHQTVAMKICSTNEMLFMIRTKRNNAYTDRYSAGVLDNPLLGMFKLSCSCFGGGRGEGDGWHLLPERPTSHTQYRWLCRLVSPTQTLY